MSGVGASIYEVEVGWVTSDDSICKEGGGETTGGSVALDSICNGARRGKGRDGAGGYDTDGIS